MSAIADIIAGHDCVPAVPGRDLAWLWDNHPLWVLVVSFALLAGVVTLFR